VAPLEFDEQLCAAKAPTCPLIRSPRFHVSWRSFVTLHRGRSADEDANQHRRKRSLLPCSIPLLPTVAQENERRKEGGAQFYTPKSRVQGGWDLGNRAEPAEFVAVKVCYEDSGERALARKVILTTWAHGSLAVGGVVHPRTVGGGGGR
jgi:hypothetical protein